MKLWVVATQEAKRAVKRVNFIPVMVGRKVVAGWVRAVEIYYTCMYRNKKGVE